MTRVDARVFAAVLPTLMAAHDLADHVVQTDHQAAGKSTSWCAMAGHVGSYHSVQLAALATLRGLVGIRPSWSRTLAGVAFSAGTHALLDRRWPVVAVLERTGSPGFAKPVVRVDVRGTAAPSALRGRDPIVEGTGAGPLPLHGPYLADQALHHAALWAAALLIASRRT